MTSADPRLVLRLQTEGRRVIGQLHSALKTVLTHDADNRASHGAALGVASAVGALTSFLPRVELVLVDDQAYVNGVRLRLDKTGVEQVARLQQVFDIHGLGGLAFGGALDADTALWLVKELADREGNARELSEDLVRHLAASKIEIIAPRRAAEAPREGALRADPALAPLYAYAKLVVAAEEGAVAVREGRDPLLLRLAPHRVLQELVDVAARTPAVLLRLAAHKDDGSYVSVHAANSALLAIVLGTILGFDRVALVELGAAALFADAGRGVDADEPSSRARAVHDITVGARNLLRAGPLSASHVLRVLVALEHHQPYLDPVSRRVNLTHPFSRIVAVADAYDALTSSRPWRAAETPPAALRTLRGEAGLRFDPLVVKALVNLSGTYPVGSIVRLGTGGVAVVVAPPLPGADPGRPRVRLVAGPRGEAAALATHDLAERPGPAGEVVEVLPSDALGVPSSLLALF